MKTIIKQYPVPCDTNIAWTAGFFDGEGCIHIEPLYSRRNKKTRPTYQLYIRIGNTHLPSLNHLKNIWGGVIMPNGAKEHKNQQWYWHAWSTLAVHILRLCLSYLVTKKHQAMVAIDFQERKTYLRENAHMPYKKLPDWYYDEDEFWSRKLKEIRNEALVTVAIR